MRLIKEFDHIKQYEQGHYMTSQKNKSMLFYEDFSHHLDFKDISLLSYLIQKNEVACTNMQVVHDEDRKYFISTEESVEEILGINEKIQKRILKKFRSLDLLYFCKRGCPPVRFISINKKQVKDLFGVKI